MHVAFVTTAVVALGKKQYKAREQPVKCDDTHKDYCTVQSVVSSCCLVFCGVLLFLHDTFVTTAKVASGISSRKQKARQPVYLYKAADLSVMMR